MFLTRSRLRYLSYKTSLMQCNKKDSETSSTTSQDYPEEPTTCCMSGCANCVWLEYAEKLSKYYRDNGEKAYEEIESRINDPNMKAFILHELRMRIKNT